VWRREGRAGRERKDQWKQMQQHQQQLLKKKKYHLGNAGAKHCEG